MKALGWAVIAGVGALGVVSFIGVQAGVRAGEFTTLAPRFDGTCTQVPALPGAEDMALDRAGGVLFVSSDNRRAPDAPRGAIYRLPFQELAQAANRTDATAGAPAAFHPHGLSLWTGPDGAQALFVVNHPQGRGGPAPSVVEIYDVPADGGPLRHRTTVALGAVTRPNDVLAVGPDSFYVTNESALPADSAREFLAQILDADGSGSIWLFQGGAGREVASGLKFANSLALSPDGATLYATATVGRRVHVYARGADGGLVERPSIFVGTGVDNIDVEPDGRVWIATHPKLLTFAVAHARQGKPAPSQVIILEPNPDGQGGKGDQVFLSDGRDLSGASVAIRDGDRLVLGSVFETHVLACALPAVWRHSQSAPHRVRVKD